MQSQSKHSQTSKIHCAEKGCFKHKRPLDSGSVVKNKSRITFHRSQNHLPHHTVGVLWTWYQCARRTPLEQAYTLLLQRRSKPTPPPPRPSPAGWNKFASSAISISAPSTPWPTPFLICANVNLPQPLVHMWDESQALSRAPAGSYQCLLSAPREPSYQHVAPSHQVQKYKTQKEKQTRNNAITN